MHEHRADSFSVIFGDTEISNELLGGAATTSTFAAGRVGFASTAQGPYSHRVVALADSDFHVIAMELMSAEPASAASLEPRADPAFELVLDNPRGRAYRIRLAPGESTGPFRRRGSTALFAISAGRIAEAVAGAGIRLWDFETGHFRWMDTKLGSWGHEVGGKPMKLCRKKVGIARPEQLRHAILAIKRTL